MALLTIAEDSCGPFLKDGSENPIWPKLRYIYEESGVVDFTGKEMEIEVKSDKIADVINAQLENGSAKVGAVHCLIGIPAKQWKADSIVSDQGGKARKWQELVDEKSYTSREHGTRHWISSGAINPQGLSVDIIQAIKAAGCDVLSNDEYAKIMPADEPIDAKPEIEPPIHVPPVGPVEGR